LDAASAYGELKRLRGEAPELRRANEILKSASVKASSDLAPGSPCSSKLCRAASFARGCRIKPPRKSRRALAERYASAAVSDELGTDDMHATDEIAVFGTQPYKTF
jgi:hypothetical protein